MANEQKGLIVKLKSEPLFKEPYFVESKSFNIDSDDSDDDNKLNPNIHYRAGTTIGAKIDRIKKPKKKKIRDINSFGDAWKWFWQHPIGHLPILYFIACLLSSIFFIIYWFMDNNSSYIYCGVVTLSMCIYSLYKFKILIGLKEQVDKYRKLNIKFKKENKILEKKVNASAKALYFLKVTKQRLVKINNKNRNNIDKMKKVEDNMKIIGKKTVKGINDMHKKVTKIREQWRDEFITNERQMLHAVFTRFEKQTSSRRSFGMDRNDFKQFEKMLPKRYGTRWKRMGTFSAFANNDDKIKYEDFANALDIFALMEIDQTPFTDQSLLDVSPYSPYSDPSLDDL